MVVITAEIESGFIAKDDLVPFRCSSISSCVAPLQTEASMGGRQGQHTQWASRCQMSFSQTPSYGSRTQGPLMKVLPVPGWRPLKQLAMRVFSYDVAVFSMTGLLRAS
ncbi:uncharacterized protein TNCV_1537461 [Trichonephila clavipes]|nr:uncharacterized protein TNCV_1537461 [Trichonephila clavipes]